MWYSFDNRIEDNDIAGARDISLANSKRNRITGNRVSGGRTALHMIFAGRTLVEGNTFSHNSGGVFALNSEGLVIRGNRILHAVSHSGAGIGLKETAAALIQDNEIVHCGVGIMADSPMHPLNRISVLGNRIAHSVTGIMFYGESGGHIVHGNRFEHNLTQVVTVGFGDAAANDWHGNYWDDYRGFDRNGDGVGDTPYELHSYADRIWAGEPKARFFSSSPLLELIDFLERLAPFSLPDLVLRDPAPQAHPRLGR
jgi:nitrous oxidase accessory protein